jgi:hypothetical protein
MHLLVGRDFIYAEAGQAMRMMVRDGQE